MTGIPGIGDRIAPDSEKRSVRTIRTHWKAKVEVCLRGLYTNDDNHLTCQICRDEMPLRKKDGRRHYFEKIEAFDLLKEYDANHLALCPVCAAK